MQIFKIKEKDIFDAATLALKLWKDSTPNELEEEFFESLQSDKQAIYICKLDTGQSIAFMNVALRFEYVEGTNSSPVGYLEGIYVEPEYRKLGIASELVKTAEDWAKNKGCSELASDAELKNIISHKFHKKIGFKEVLRIVTYIKSLE